MTCVCGYPLVATDTVCPECGARLAFQEVSSRGDCDGFRFHSKPCAHLCALAQLDVLEDVVPIDERRAQEIAFGIDAEVVDHTETQTADEVLDEDVQEDDAVDDVESKPVSDDEPQGSTRENRPVTPSNSAKVAESEVNTFAGELPDVPDQFVMELGGDTYIRRAGYARLAYSAGLRLELEEIVGAHEMDWDHAKYAARVIDEDGQQVANDVGSAHADAEDLQDAHANLDELAATRAASRAMAWATGEGLNAVEEIAADQAVRAQEGGS